MGTNNSQTKLCILGCGGFIGSHLIARLVEDGRYHIIGVDIESSKIARYLSHPNLEFHELNIYDTGAVREHIDECDIVISLVALCNPAMYNTIPLDVIEANFTRPLEVVKMCAELNKWIIHFSTSEVYGQTLSHFLGSEAAGKPEYHVLDEDDTPLILGPIKAQRWTYACAKQLLERVIYAYSYEKGLEYSIVRPFNFIGPRMDYIPGVDGDGTPRVLACFMEALMRGKQLRLVDGGVNRRTITYINDAIDAVVRILDNKDQAVGHAFNIGHPDNEISIAALASEMIRVYKEIVPSSVDIDYGPVYVSSKEFYGEGYEDSDRRVPDITKAVERLGWDPEVDLETALCKTISSYVRDYADACAHRAAC